MSTDHTLTHAHHPLTTIKVEVGTLTLISDESLNETLSSTLNQDPSHQWSINSQRSLIGSLESCHVPINFPAVSRQHAAIEVDHRGYRVVDTESKNGVYVNNIRVIDAFLSDGDVIQIGSVRLLFRLHKERSNSISLWGSDSFGDLYGDSSVMRELFALLHRVSSSKVNVLIEGESGTGKELAARAIHQHSSRAQSPFMVFDCSSVPSHLIESELFGHIRGAFTGAQDQRQGAFMSAQGGTLFIDEIGELPLNLQPKLLRALERREVKPVGGDVYQAVDVRVISATHKSLQAEVDQHRFRLDLYYRLAVILVSMPPLRQHPEDIPGLIERMINSLSPGANQEISYKTMNLLLQHHWAGNIRELKNYVQRAIALSDPQSDRIDTHFLLPSELSSAVSSAFRDTSLISKVGETPDHSNGRTLEFELRANQDFKSAKAELIEDFERAYWYELIHNKKLNTSAAARVAGIHRKSAEYIIKKLNLKGDERDV